MLTETQIQSRNLVIEQIDNLITKYEKKAEKEKAKKKRPSVTYKGETFYSDRELQEAYACDVFSSTTFDRLLTKLDKAFYENGPDLFTPSELLVMDLNAIKTDFKTELHFDQVDKQKKEAREARAQELVKEGYSFREIETIIGNEELMRYE